MRWREGTISRSFNFITFWMEVIRKGERWKKILYVFSDVIADCSVRVGSKSRKKKLATSTLIGGGIVDHGHTTSFFFVFSLFLRC